MAWKIVKKWGEFGGIGEISPHDLRRTAITKALDLGLTYRQVQMMTGHKEPKTVMHYDRHREFGAKRRQFFKLRRSIHWRRYTVL